MSTQRRARSVQMNGLASFAPIAQVNRGFAQLLEKRHPSSVFTRQERGISKLPVEFAPKSRP